MTTERLFYVYTHARPDGRVFYVGKGTGARSHNLKRDHNTHHKNIVAKYGAANIIVEVTHCINEEQAFVEEARLIQAYRAAGLTLCNRTDGGEGATGRVHTEEAARNMSLGQKRRAPCIAAIEAMRRANTNKETSDITRARLSAASTGKKPDAETRSKMSEAAKRRVRTPENEAKRKAAARAAQTPEVAAKISAALKGLKRSPETIAKMRLAAVARERIKKLNHG